MEIAVSGLPMDSKYWYIDEYDGVYFAVCDWYNVGCDDEQRVIEIQRFHSGHGGPLALDFLPPHVKYVDIQGNSHKLLQGTLSTEALPHPLEEFNTSFNSFTGTVDFTKLPSELTAFLISRNEFFGTCNFEALPPKLRTLVLAMNRFTGCDVARASKDSRFIRRRR